MMDRGDLGVRSAPERVGDRDGYGRFGELDDDGQTVLCHECGRRRRSLGRHIRVHGMTAAEYRQAHGLSTGCSLIGAELRGRLSELTRSHPTSLAALAAHRDVHRARAAVTAEGHHRPQRQAIRRRTAHHARLGRELSSADKAALTRAESVRAWCMVVHQLVATGASVRGIATQTGISPATAAGRIARYPAA
ncbi:MAG: MucR family transcriptional regulator [Jatrophihabitantaceae bacterium]